MKLFIFALAILIFAGCEGKNKLSSYLSEDTELLVLFVHGYRGRVNLSRFSQDMQPILSKYNKYYHAETYTWDSAGSWRKAKKEAKKEAKTLANQIKIYEDGGTPYYLIGYSLGAKVVIESLKQSSNDLTKLRGVYLLGAADNMNQQIGTGLFKQDFKIINYHSPYHDKTLKRYYQMAEFGEKAGGRKGFANEEEFTNYETGASHSPSDGECNFFNMAKSIAHLIAYNEQQSFHGSDNLAPSPLEYSSENKRWNNILKLNNYMIQQNSCDKNDNNYRAIDNNDTVWVENGSLLAIIQKIQDKLNTD